MGLPRDTDRMLFADWVRGMSVLLRGKASEIIALYFDCADCEQAGHVHFDACEALWRSLFRVRYRLKPRRDGPFAALADSFHVLDGDCDGFLSFGEFERLVYGQPLLCNLLGVADPHEEQFNRDVAFQACVVEGAEGGSPDERGRDESKRGMAGAAATGAHGAIGMDWEAIVTARRGRASVDSPPVQRRVSQAGSDDSGGEDAGPGVAGDARSAVVAASTGSRARGFLPLVRPPAIVITCMSTDVGVPPATEKALGGWFLSDLPASSTVQR